MRTSVYFFTHKTSAGISRKLTLIDGVPFYESSGTNSGWPQTWFPFLGIDMESGWYRKPGFIDSISNQIDTIPRQYDSFFPSADIRQRFTSLKCLLISSQLGGGFWNTAEGQRLLECLKNDHPGFYEKNDYRLLDTRKIFSEENTVAYSVERKKVVQQMNGLLEKGVKNPLSFNFNASGFCQNFIKHGFSKADLFSLTDHLHTRPRPHYLKAPEYNVPNLSLELHWPADFEKSLHLTEEQRLDTEEFIRKAYPLYQDDITNNPDYLSYSRACLEKIGNKFQGSTTHVNIHILNNGNIVVYPYNLDVVYQRNDTIIFKVFNLSTNEWMVLKNCGRIDFIPYEKELSKHHDITDICDFTSFDNHVSQVMKLYDKNLAQYLCEPRTKPLSITEKIGFMLSIARGIQAIHTTPFQFANTEGFLFHGDVKFENFLIDSQSGEIKVSDLGETGRWDLLVSSSYYMPPELALELMRLKLSGGRDYVTSNIITFNKNKGRGIDVWNLGLVFAGVLQGELINHDVYVKNVFLPKLKFILERVQRPPHEHTFLAEIAGLQQDDIDEELNDIKAAIPQSAQTERLLQLWDIVHQMLRVNPAKRLTISQLVDKIELLQPMKHADVVDLIRVEPSVMRNNSFFKESKILPDEIKRLDCYHLL